jgi:hypothetical protein
MTYLKTGGHGEATGTVPLVYTSWQSMQNNHCPIHDFLAIEVHAMIFINSLPANNCTKPINQTYKLFTFKTIIF